MLGEVHKRAEATEEKGNNRAGRKRPKEAGRQKTRETWPKDASQTCFLLLASSATVLHSFRGITFIWKGGRGRG